MGSLLHRTVVVVGGTQGIGLATAVAASAKGAKVWSAGRSEEKIARAAAEHPDIHFRVADIHDEETIKSLLDDAGAAVDHLVAAATGAERRTIAPFAAQTDAQFRAAFDKLWGYANLARAGAPRVRPGGSLTFVSGIPARSYVAGMSSIGCAGSAVEALMRALAVEMAPDVRVNAVAPGVIGDTAMFDSFGEEEKARKLEELGKRALLGRVGRADEVAEAVIMCMLNSYMTGATVDVDGGALLR